MLGERLGQLGDAPHFAALLRDWEHFAALDPASGLPLDAALVGEHAKARGSFVSGLEGCRAAELVLGVLEADARTLSQVRQSQAAAQYPFVMAAAPHRLAPSLLREEVLRRTERLTDTACRLLPGTAAAHPPDSPPTRTPHHHHLESLIRKATDDITAACRTGQQLHQQTLLPNLVEAGRNLQHIHERMVRLWELLAPMGERYLAALADYIVTVIESLQLKLEIVELETWLQTMDGAALDSLGRLDRQSRDYQMGLEQIVQQQETQLCLFQQLGPAVTRIAQQYQQILSQIDLVNEDLAQLQ